MGAFQGYSIKDGGALLQDISSSSGAAGQYPRLQTGPGSQTQLPPIAPRPLTQETPDYYSRARVSASTWPHEEYSSYANAFNQAPTHFAPPEPQIYPRQDGPSIEPHHYYCIAPSAENVSSAVSHPIVQSLPTGSASRNASLSRPNLTQSWSQPSITPQYEYSHNPVQLQGAPEGYEPPRRADEHPSQPLHTHSHGANMAIHQQFTQQHSDIHYQPFNKIQSEIDVSNWDTIGGMHVYPDRYGGTFDVPISLY